MRHEAIRNLYPAAVTIDDSSGVFDINGNAIIVDEAAIKAELPNVVKQKEAEKNSKAEAKAAAQAKLAALGLTVEDLQALGL